MSKRIQTTEFSLAARDLLEELDQPGPLLDIMTLVVSRDRYASHARAAALTELLTMGRAILLVEHNGRTGRIVVDALR